MDNQARQERQQLIGFAEVGVIFAAKTGERPEDRQSQMAATSVGLLLDWLDGPSFGRNDQIQKNFEFQKFLKNKLRVIRYCR
jgi:hypothetical protein